MKTLGTKTGNSPINKYKDRKNVIKQLIMEIMVVLVAHLDVNN